MLKLILFLALYALVLYFFIVGTGRHSFLHVAVYRRNRLKISGVLFVIALVLTLVFTHYIWWFLTVMVIGVSSILVYYKYIEQ